MKFRSVIYIAGWVVLLGCAHTRSPNPLPVDVSGLILTPRVQAEDADTKAMLSSLSSAENRETYRADETSVHALLSLRMLKDRHTVQWRWIDPSGNLFIETPPVSVGERGDTYKEAHVFHTIDIKEAAAQQTGEWKVQMLLDKTGVIERLFRIEPVIPAPPPPVLVEIPAVVEEVIVPPSPLGRWPVCRLHVICNQPGPGR